jgi:putative flippase GtrA
VKKLLSNEKVRFLLAGCANTALDFILLNVLVFAFATPTLVANAISVTLGICVSYLLNHFFVFRYNEPISLKRFAMFFLVTGFSSLVLQNLVILGFEALFGTDFGRSLLFLPGEDGKQFLALNIAKATAVLLGLIWNFVFYKFVVFRGERHAEAAPAADRADAPTRRTVTGLASESPAVPEQPAVPEPPAA